MTKKTISEGSPANDEKAGSPANDEKAPRPGRNRLLGVLKKAKFPSGTTITAVTVAFMGILGNEALEKHDQANLYAQLIAQREESSSALRQDMFKNMMTMFFEKRQSANSQEKWTENEWTEFFSKRILQLEMLALNFGEVMTMGPLFHELSGEIRTHQEQIKKAEKQNPGAEDALGAEIDHLERLNELATTVSAWQLAALPQTNVAKYTIEWSKGGSDFFRWPRDLCNNPWYKSPDAKKALKKAVCASRADKRTMVVIAGVTSSCLFADELGEERVIWIFTKFSKGEMRSKEEKGEAFSKFSKGEMRSKEEKGEAFSNVSKGEMRSKEEKGEAFSNIEVGPKSEPSKLAELRSRALKASRARKARMKASEEESKVTDSHSDEESWLTRWLHWGGGQEDEKPGDGTVSSEKKVPEGNASDESWLTRLLTWGGGQEDEKTQGPTPCEEISSSSPECHECLSSFGEVTRFLSVDFFDADHTLNTVTAKVAIRAANQPPQELTVNLDFYDFPMIDSVRLSHDHRLALVLRSLKKDQIKATLVLFPGMYGSQRDKPFLDVVMQQLPQIIE